MRNFWNSFCNEIKERQFIRTLIEWFGFVVVFNLINYFIYDGKASTYASMLAGAALYIAISNRRRLDNR